MEIAELIVSFVFHGSEEIASAICLDDALDGRDGDVVCRIESLDSEDGLDLAVVVVGDRDLPDAGRDPRVLDLLTLRDVRF